MTPLQYRGLMSMLGSEPVKRYAMRVLRVRKGTNARREICAQGGNLSGCEVIW